MLEVQPITNQLVKQRAEKLLLDSGYAGQFPVPTCEIAGFLGFAVYSFKPSKQDQNISGAVYHEERKIFFNKHERLRRNIFTIAHEIGHIILHGANQDHIDYKKSTSLNDKERQADEFAACLLMPESVFRRLCEKTKNDYEALSDFFKVPLPEVYIRASNLKIG
jgi:Zn-dependent peptidase ImmA (M78 family)